MTKHIFSSATRTTLILLVVSLIVFTQEQIVDPKDFVQALFMVMAFFFGKSQSEQKIQTTKTTSISPNSDV